ncbi:two-component system, OmpR family, sensor kinase [Lentzea xinjiangensis]|uniref:histidine kinase n=1 Tax=Lentzea xinjiangensis TaxID=402600 RepID=A0A1H9UCT1_9PSEU|nr:HAMP domain-containing sensor histidine kinase [Lentzea xinjiangensis]SES06964.1 two-component system, OmpR family, sensor kinase [Lentzea xinjiangensis]
MRRVLGGLSLRTRLLLLTASLLLAGLGLVGAVVSDQLERYQLDRIDAQLRSLGEILARVPATGPLGTVGAVGTEARPDLLDPALGLIGAPYLVYVGADGAVVGGLHSSRLDGASLPGPGELRTVPTGGAPVDLPAADGSGRWRATARPTTGWDGTVVVAASLAEADATTARLRTTSLVSGAVLLLLLTAVGWFALGRGLRPLRRIEQTAAAIADGDLTRRVPVLAAPTTEVGHLAASLNTMLGQLEQAFADRAASEARMRTFLSDVSHELRTPLFGIKGSTELYRMGAMPERADVDEAMLRIDREATRLTSLTEDLLLLARLDEAPQAQLDPAPMDLRTLANDARHDLRGLDPSRPVELTGPAGAGPPGPAPVHADEDRLRQVVTNLIGNAATYTPPGTAVRIGVGTVNGRAVLEVADRGPGLPAHQAARVFDRFYRADHSRTRAGGANAGLGLAIARALARAHDGDVELDTSLGGGACFRLTLPLLDRR